MKKQEKVPQAKPEQSLFRLDQVIEAENEVLRKRRDTLFSKEEVGDLEDNKFGIALSGGGVRSATINLGFLKALNMCKVLEKADYLSTVSGGGYTGSYIQATLKSPLSTETSSSEKTTKDPQKLRRQHYDVLFNDQDIDQLRSFGDYWIPGQAKSTKLWNTLVLAIGYIASLIMSWISPAIIILIFYSLFRLIMAVLDMHDDTNPLNWDYPGNQIFENLIIPFYGTIAILVIHFFANLLFNLELGVSRFFNKLESGLSLAFFFYFLVVIFISIEPEKRLSLEEMNMAVLLIAGLLIGGLFANPNSISFHRFYRNQLANAYLNRTGKSKNILLKDIFKWTPSNWSNFINPFPLINTCLNLQNPSGGEKFKGAKASDYFLLSPLFSGSKLSKYINTSKFPGYRHLTLPAATTISAAAVNPGMGIYSNKLLSIFMTIFNARLGFWVNNPLKMEDKKRLPRWIDYLVWWPVYFFYELLSKIDTSNRKLNISDGGHIENLAVYELLRRKCRLIIAVDAGADPTYSFADLENLTVRARNELGIDISFREDPLVLIRPNPSSGYSKQRHVKADLYTIWEEFYLKDEMGKYYECPQDEGTGEKPKQRVEILVNYSMSGEPTIEVKAVPKNKEEEAFFNEMTEIAKTQIRKKLEATEKAGRARVKIGTFVYVKSSVVAPKGKPFIPKKTPSGKHNYKFDAYKYKIYHPDFPHEPTSDQFFDPVQWESYYQLGQFMGVSILPIDGDKYLDLQKDPALRPNISINDLINHFDEVAKRDMLDDLMQGSPRFKKRSTATDSGEKKAVGYEM